MQQRVPEKTGCKSLRVWALEHMVPGRCSWPEDCLRQRLTIKAGEQKRAGRQQQSSLHPATNTHFPVCAACTTAETGSSLTLSESFPSLDSYLQRELEVRSVRVCVCVCVATVNENIDQASLPLAEPLPGVSPQLGFGGCATALN